MVQKHVWMAAGVLAVLVGIFFLTRDDPATKVEPALTIVPPSQLGRLEWERPDGERVVLESRKSGWWLTSPVEAPLSRQGGSEVSWALGRTLKSDDLRYKMSEDRTFGLSEDEAVDVAIFEAGESDPTTRLRVGDTMTILKDGVPATFVQVEGDERVYRLRVTSLGDLVRMTVDDLRSRSIVSLGDTRLRSVQWSHADGHLLKIEAVPSADGGGWMWAIFQREMGLDAATVGRFVNTLTRFNASDFVDEGDPLLSTLNFENAPVRVALETASKIIELAVVIEGEGDAAQTYVRRGEDGQVFEVAASARPALLARLVDVKDRAVLPIASDAITSLELAGEDQVRLEKAESGQWTMVRPSGFEVDQSEVTSFISWLGALRAERWVEDVEERQAGLTPAQRSSVRVSAEDHEDVLYLGASTEELRGERYARLASSPEIFVLPEGALRRLRMSASDFAASTNN